MLHIPLTVYVGAWLAAAVMMAGSKANAASIAGIGNATINEDQMIVTWRQSYGSDNENHNLDARVRERIMFDYGFTDSFASGLYLQGDRRDGQDMELEGILWDSRFELTTVKDDGYYSGFRIRYTYRDGDKKPDNLHLRTIIGGPIGKWELRANPIFYTDLGPDSKSGLGIDLRTQVTYEYAQGHRAGIESFFDMGNLRLARGYQRMSQDIGAVFWGNFTPEWGYETGYGYGITKLAPDHTAKLFIIRYF